MFNASHLCRCHLLLGNLALIILGGLTLLNSLVIGNDINLSNNRIRQFKNQNKNSISVHTNLVNYLPQLDFYKDIFRKRKDDVFSSNYQNYRNYEHSRDENDESKIFRFKKDNSNRKTSTIESKKLYQKSIRSSPLLYTSSNDLLLSNEEKIQTINNITNDFNKVMITTISSINLISTTSPATTPATTTTTGSISYKGSTNYDRNYKYYDREWRKHNPNRMNKEASLVSWNELLKLILLLLVCTAGTTGNIFVISSIMVIEQFQTQGNVYIVSLALGQLAITVIALPGTCVEIMAVKPNHPTICHLQWILTQFTLVITLLSFMFISIENCSALRVRAAHSHNIFCSKLRIIFLVVLTWVIAGLIVYTQNTQELAPAFCKQAIESNKNKVWLQYHLSIAICVILLPTLITIICFTRCSLKVKVINEQFELNPLNSPWQNVSADGELVKANVMVYIFMFLAYLPLCIIAPLSVNKQASQEWLNASWSLSWFGNCFYSFVYAFFNQNFGKTFFKLFYYCCCKSHLQFDSKTTINLRRNLATPGTNNMELRVHIIPGLNMNQRTHDHHHNHNYLNHHHHLSSNSNLVGGRNPRTIPASDGGLGWSHGNTSGGFNKWHSRVDSDQSNYSSNFLMNRARNYTYGANYSSHLVDSKDYYFGK